MKCDLKGTVSLVTGAAGGIGLAIAERLAQNGSRVVFSDIDQEGAGKAASRFPGCLGIRLDVTQSDQVEAALESVIRNCGKIDLLVNNAGVNTLDHREIGRAHV